MDQIASWRVLFATDPIGVVIAAPICLSVAAIMSVACGRSSRVSAQLSRRKAERPADEYFGEIHEIRR
jgi:hypothetical protein